MFLRRGTGLSQAMAIVEAHLDSAIMHASTIALYRHAGPERVQTRKTKLGSGQMPKVAPAHD